MSNPNMEAINSYFENENKRFYARQICGQFEKLISDGKFSNKDIEENPVFKALELMIGDAKGTFFYTIEPGTSLFRAREIKRSDDWNRKKTGIYAGDKDGTFSTKGFDKYGSKEAPIGIPPSGRSNIAGMSYLYLAEDQYTACAEIRPIQRSVISIAEFIPQKPLHVIDLSEDKITNDYLKYEEDLIISPDQKKPSITAIMTWIMNQFARPVSNDSIYILSQLLADYIRKAGFDGVRYLSSTTRGKNVTIFNSHESYIRFKRSKLVLNHSLDYNIIDIETGKHIDPGDYYDIWNDTYLVKVRSEIASGIH